jgi:hypothetical protein
VLAHSNVVNTIRPDDDVVSKEIYGCLSARTTIGTEEVAKRKIIVTSPSVQEVAVIVSVQYVISISTCEIVVS